jgi:predicted nucleotidyltransferase
MRDTPIALTDELARAARVLTSPRPVSVYLFGSHAKGRAHRESDVDIAVLIRHEEHATPRDRFEARLALISHFAAALHRDDVDIVLLNDAPPHLGRAVVTAGRRVFCADESRDHAYVRDVQLRAADVDPWLRRMRAIKLEAIAR